MEASPKLTLCESQSSPNLFPSSSSPSSSPGYTMTVQGKIFRPWDQPIPEAHYSGGKSEVKSKTVSQDSPATSSSSSDYSKLSLKSEVKACRSRMRHSESAKKMCPVSEAGSSQGGLGESYEEQLSRSHGPQSVSTSFSEEPLSPTESDYHVSRGPSPSNLFLYPMAINELANLSRNELTAIGLLPPEPPGSQKAKRQRPKRFHCPHCQVAFSNNGQLRGHIRIHTGERPFVCEHESCGKSFTRNEELTRHRRIHTGLRPYPCTYCGKKFGRKDHLKKHTRTHQRVMYATPSMIGYGSPFQPFHPPILSTAMSSELSLAGVSPFGFPLMPSLSSAHHYPQL